MVISCFSNYRNKAALLIVVMLIFTRGSILGAVSYVFRVEVS